MKRANCCRRSTFQLRLPLREKMKNERPNNRAIGCDGNILLQILADASFSMEE